jgi:hypothetical protein
MHPITTIRALGCGASKCTAMIVRPCTDEPTTTVDGARVDGAGAVEAVLVAWLLGCDALLHAPSTGAMVSATAAQRRDLHRATPRS